VAISCQTVFVPAAPVAAASCNGREDAETVALTATVHVTTSMFLVQTKSRHRHRIDRNHFLDFIL